MNNIKVILVSFILLFHIDYSQVKNDNYNVNLYKVIFSSYDLKTKLISMFDLNEKGMKVFKVLISRRNQFVRISIFQIINKEEVEEYPSSYFIFKTNIFLCYDGSEIISNNHLEEDFINKLKRRLESNVVNDSRVFQFDLYNKKKVVVHVPAINPYDLIEKTHISFP